MTERSRGETLEQGGEGEFANKGFIGLVDMILVHQSNTTFLRLRRCVAMKSLLRPMCGQTVEKRDQY